MRIMKILKKIPIVECKIPYVSGKLHYEATFRSPFYGYGTSPTYHQGTWCESSSNSTDAAPQRVSAMRVIITPNGTIEIAD